MWRNDPELIANLGTPFRYINVNVDKNWLASYMNNRSTQVRCAIVDDKNDEILGVVSIDHMNGCAELHIMISSKENQGKEIGTFSVNEMLRYAFYNLNLYRIEFTVVQVNECAHRLYKKCGFIK